MLTTKRAALAGLILFYATFPPQPAHAQKPSSPVVASGTLNIVLANKNGFVIAADSRMSSNRPFPCTGHPQLYCDNSQKLFRTGPRSAMVIAGFAVGQAHSPLDLSVASVLRKRFGPDGLPGENGGVEGASDWAKDALRQALIGVAALHDPEATSPSDLLLAATFAGFDKSGQVVLRKLQFTGSWKPSGPLNVNAPEYEVESAAVTATAFFPFANGITPVANAIFAGYYKTQDPVIQRYYQKRREGALDNLSVDEMKGLAKAILRETRRFTPLVGGEDQIGVFPVAGDVQWVLPNLPTDKDLPARFYLWKGLQCSNGTPHCKEINGGSAFSEDWQRGLDEPIVKFFLVGQFKEIPVALDGNYFVNDSFEGSTLKWRGDHFFMHGNHFNNCVLELPEGAELPQGSELSGKCRLLRKSEVSIDPSTVGSPIKWKATGCVKKNPDGGVTIGGNCSSNFSILQGPIPQP